MSLKMMLAVATAALRLSLGTVHAASAAKPAAAPAASTTLDRAALLKLADDYFSALVAHDPKRMPFAPEPAPPLRTVKI